MKMKMKEESDKLNNKRTIGKYHDSAITVGQAIQNK